MKIRSRSIVAATAGAFVAYLAASLMFFARVLPSHLADYYIGRNTDPSNYMWALAWWPYVLRHHVHPLLTKLIDAPIGTNLASAPAPMPLIGIMMTPLTNAVGPIAAYNLISLLLPPLAAFAAFILCRKLCGSFLPALLVGFIFGFSPYVIGQLLSHMNLLLIFPLPLAIYLAVSRAQENISRYRFIGLLTLVLSLQFLLVLEPFAMMPFVAGITLLVTLPFASEEDRGRILRLIPEIAAAYFVTALLMSPYLYFYFAYSHPTRPLWPSILYSADLLNFIVPTTTNAIGNLAPLEKISAQFPGNIFEQGACIGIPLFAIAAIWRRRHRGELMPKLLLATVAVSCILALGPFLQVGGHAFLPMPWLLVEKLPLIKGALPIRLTLYVFLALALIFAMWLCDPLTGPTEKAIGAFATMVMLMPNPAASFWASRVPLPEFFRDGSSRRLLTSNDVVLPLPFGQKGMATLWQASGGMNFRLVSGLNGLQPIEIRRWPVANVFFGSFDLPEPELQLKAFVANLGITAIVVDASDPRAPQWRQLLSSLQVTPDEVGGILLYRINLGALRSYRAMNAIDLEQRADRARFEALLSATNRYFTNGGDPAALSVPALEAAGLFPAGWNFDPAPNTYRDIWSGSIEGKIGLGVVGAESSLQPIIDSYRADAEKIYFPYPHRWPREGAQYDFLRYFFAPQIWGSTSGESLQMMLLEFDPSHLHQLAARVASQPSLSLADAPREAAR
ncbi:MAG TPA: hypothetical protein VKV03_13160 [Candidatus Binataceae bacterium]|nr:hypothetical protein [Candidatus Binataceae bacterium]